MSYSERAYFDGDHCQHVAAYEDHLLARRRERARVRALADRQWKALPEPLRARDHASAHLAAMPADRLAALNLEWENAR